MHGRNSMTSGSGSSQLPFETVQHGTGRKKSQSLFTIFQGLVHEPLPDIQPHEILVGLLLAPRRVIFARYFLYRQRDGFQKIFFSCFSSTICLRSEKVSDAACIICPYGSPDPVPEPKMHSWTFPWPGMRHPYRRTATEVPATDSTKHSHRMSCS